LQTDWTSWQFDEAAALAGMQAEAAMMNGEQPDLKAHNSSGTGGRQYRSAKHLARKTMKIPKSGVW
jgi:hypothetical protein